MKIMYNNKMVIKNIIICENCNKNKPYWVMRLTTSHGELQNPFRFRNRIPARIAVCEDCADNLMHTELVWAKESEFTGEIVNAEEL